MSTALALWDRRLAAVSSYLPDYNHTHQIIGTAIYAAIVVIGVVAFIIIHSGRGR